MRLSRTQRRIDHNHNKNVTKVKGKKVLGYIFAGGIFVLSIVGGNAILNPPSNGYILERSNIENDVKNTGNAYNYLFALGVAVTTLGAAVGIYKKSEDRILELEELRNKKTQIKATRQIMQKPKMLQLNKR